jgi:hypothetical protein
MRHRGAILEQTVRPNRLVGVDAPALRPSPKPEPIRFCGAEVVVVERMPRGVSSFVVRGPRTR